MLATNVHIATSGNIEYDQDGAEPSGQLETYPRLTSTQSKPWQSHLGIGPLSHRLWGAVNGFWSQLKLCTRYFPRKGQYTGHCKFSLSGYHSPFFLAIVLIWGILPGQLWICKSPSYAVFNGSPSGRMPTYDRAQGLRGSAPTYLSEWAPTSSPPTHNPHLPPQGSTWPGLVKRLYPSGNWICGRRWGGGVGGDKT